MRVFKYIIPIIVFSALLVFSKAVSYASAPDTNLTLAYFQDNISFGGSFNSYSYFYNSTVASSTYFYSANGQLYWITRGYYENSPAIFNTYYTDSGWDFNASAYHPLISRLTIPYIIYPNLASAQSAMNNYEPNAPDPTIYDESITLGTLFKTEVSLLNVTGGILDAGCIYIWWGFGNAKSIDFTVLVNGFVTQRFSRSNSFILQYADFNYSDIPAGNGDIVTVQALPLDEDGNWGNIKSISFTVNTNYVRDHGNGITDNPSVTPTLYGSSPYIQPVPVVEYRGKESSIVSTTTVYVQNYTYTGISQEQFEELLQLIRDLPGALQHGDEPSDITSENDYQFKINFGDSSQGQYDSGKGFISSTADDTGNIVGNLVGTPFEPISDSIFTVLAVLVGIAFVLVLIKVVGLII